MNSKILVIGGSGFLGKHLVRLLHDGGNAIAATFASSPPEIGCGRVRWIQSDLELPEPERDWPKDVESIVFLAQGRNYRKSPEGNGNVFDVNVAGLFRTAEFARKVGAKRLLLASSGNVYGQMTKPGRDDEPIAALAPRNFYSTSKLMAEMLLRPYESMFSVISLRIFMPYGAGQSDDMLFPRLMQRIRTGQPVSLNRPDGLVGNPVAAEDVAEAFCRCMVLDRSLTLNLGGPQTLTLRRIAETMGQAIGSEPRFEMSDGAPPVIVGDTTRLRQELGWAPSLKLETGLQRWLSATDSRAA